MSFVLAIDQGTTSSRAIVFRGRLHRGIGAAGIPAALSGARAGSSTTPRTSGSAARRTSRAALGEAGRRRRRHRGHRHHQPARDDGRLGPRAPASPIHRAIVWQDRRTADVCARAARRTGTSRWSPRKTGLLLDPYFSGTKIAWLLDHVPGARARAERGELAFGTVDTLLIWRLTGGAVHATDATNASRTLLLRHPRRRAGTTSCCDRFDVPRALLPEVRDCAGDFGATEPRAARRADPDPRHRRRSAGGAVRPGLLRARAW